MFTVHSPVVTLNKLNKHCATDFVFSVHCIYFHTQHSAVRETHSCSIISYPRYFQIAISRKIYTIIIKVEIAIVLLVVSLSLTFYNGGKSVNIIVLVSLDSNIMYNLYIIRAI